MVVHRHTGVGVWDILRVLFFMDVLICLRRVTFFPCRKKVTKERHLRKGGFRFPPFLKNLFPLKRPKGRAATPPLWKPPPGEGDYQIAPLPQSGKGRWRPMAAIGEKGSTSKNRLFLFENTLRGGIFRHFAQFCRKNLSYQPKCKKFPCPRLQLRKRSAILKTQVQTGTNPYRGFPFFVRAKNEACWL